MFQESAFYSPSISIVFTFSAFRRDSSGIPSIVRKCVAEVERRGMNEVGIYRVSGVASEIQELKASFDAGNDGRCFYNDIL